MSATTVNSLPAVLSSLAHVQAREKAVGSELAGLVASHDKIDASLARLRALGPSLDELLIDADLLQTKVHATAKTADRVGGRVRTLDEEMRRIREAAERVAQVTDLKSSLAALYDAIDRGDWEGAARHCAKVMAIPANVLNGHFAARAVPTSELPLPPPQSLQAARDTLLYNFQSHFEQAAAARDAAATSRFFKLFPSVGWHSEGLEAYSAFVVDLVASRATTSAKPSSPMYFVASLTSLFESVALIIDQHQPLVEKYYGSQAMKPVVVKLLEACHRSLAILLEAWDEERQMPRKLSDVATAVATAVAPAATIRRQGTQAAVPAEDTIDPRDIDKVISELSGLASRWAVFRRFVVLRLGDADTDEETVQNDDAAAASTSEPVLDTSLVDSSACKAAIDGILDKYYLPLEAWYMHTICEKAHRLAQPSTSNSGITITTLSDDVFYVLKVALVRLLTTGSTNTVTKTCGALKELISKDLVGVLKRKMDDIYRPGVAGARSEKGERDARAVYIAHLNDLALTASHLERLSTEVAASPVIDQNFLEGHDGADDVRKAIAQLGGEVASVRSVLKTCVEHLFTHTARPRLRTLWPDAYKDVSYMLDDEAYAIAEQTDLVRKRFTKAWELAAEPVKERFSEENARLFFGLMVDVVARPWERYLMGLRFTELGAIRFDQDLRFVMAYLNGQVHASVGLRERFTRLQQIATLLNLDAEEDLDEFYNGSGIAWRVSIAEARAVVGLRV